MLRYTAVYHTIVGDSTELPVAIWDFPHIFTQNLKKEKSLLDSNTPPLELKPPPFVAGPLREPPSKSKLRERGTYVRCRL